MSVNKVILVGNLGKDPEVRHLDNNRAVANFSIATSENYKNKLGEKVTNTEWHNVVFWSPLAEIAEKYLQKGKQVYIEGKMVTRSYEDKEGQTKYVTEVVGRNLVMLGSKDAATPMSTPEASPQVAEPIAEAEGVQNSESSIDELPF